MENKDNKRGRPKKEAAKLTKSINLKLTPADYSEIAQKAASLGMKPTQYARQMALNGSIKSRFTKEELNLWRKLAGMANNINQLARKAHSEGFMKEALQGIMILNQIRSLLNDSKKHKG